MYFKHHFNLDLKYQGHSDHDLTGIHTVYQIYCTEIIHADYKCGLILC